MLNENEKTALVEANQAIEEVRQLLIKTASEKSTKALIETINNSFILELKTLVQGLQETIKTLKEIAHKSAVDKEQILEAVKSIELKPEIKVNIPDFPQFKMPEIKVPEVKIPAFKIPTPQVTVKSPDINIPEIKMPKEMEVKGLSGMIKSIGELLKSKLTFDFKDINRDNPIPVILTDESGAFYKAIMRVTGMGGGGGAPRIVGIRDKDDRLVSPLSEGHSGVGTGTGSVTTSGTPVQLPDIPCKKVKITCSEWNGDPANCPNGGLIVIGDANIVPTLATRQGLPLFPTGSEWFYVNNLNLLYIDALDNGAKFHYFYEI